LIFSLPVHISEQANLVDIVDIKNFLQQNVRPVTGCTEPAAIAYASSVAYHALSGCIPPDYPVSTPITSIDRILSIEVLMDRNVYKNTANAIIPGTDGCKGPCVAAAAGIFLDPRDGLDVFSGMTPEKRGKTFVLSRSERVSCQINPDAPEGISPDIRVEVTAETVSGKRCGMAHISGDHSILSEVRTDGVPVFAGLTASPHYHPEMPPSSIIWLIRIAESMDKPEIEEAYRGVAMNLALVSTGMDRSYGLDLGNSLRTVLTNQKGFLSLVDKVKIAAAIAGDVRMGGAPYPVMSTSGSGNQGITALVPVGVIGMECNFSKEEISRAALISHMVTKQADRYSGHLSALCGCSVKAGIGATAGVTYLIGGGSDEITTAINLLVATITGTICDGAKPGCALKISTAAGIATECAFLAMGGMKIPPDNGIIQKSAPGTLRVLEKISKAMIPVDSAIIGILNDNSHVNC